jgi:hypothetical protein
MGIQKDGEKVARYKKPEYVYRDIELKSFDEQMQKYKAPKTDKMGGYVVYDYEQFLKDCGALNKNGAVVVTSLTRHRTANDYTIDSDPVLFEAMMDKIEQWQEWKGRQEWGEKQRLAQLEVLEGANKLVAGMEIKSEV